MAEVRREVVDAVSIDFLASSSGFAFLRRMLATLERAQYSVGAGEALARIEELLGRRVGGPVGEDDVEIAVLITHLLKSGVVQVRSLLDSYVSGSPPTIVTLALEMLRDAGSIQREAQPLVFHWGTIHSTVYRPSKSALPENSDGFVVVDRVSVTLQQAANENGVGIPEEKAAA